MTEQLAFDFLAARAYRSSNALHNKLAGLPSLPAIADDVKTSLNQLLDALRSLLLREPCDGLSMDLSTLSSTLNKFDAYCKEFEQRIQSQTSDEDWYQLTSSSQNILCILGIPSALERQAALESAVRPPALEHGDGIQATLPKQQVGRARRSTQERRQQVGFYPGNLGNTRVYNHVPPAPATHARDDRVTGFSIIDNYSIGDAVQFMVSTDPQVNIRGSNVGLGPRTRQVGGHLSDETLQRLAEEIRKI
ncbi:hypothetical protein BJX99DRAFT_101154 [Aspergillus californicus]